MKASQFKIAAKEALKGKWGIAIGVFFIYSILSAITGFIPDGYLWLSGLILIFFVGPLSVGYQWFFLEVKRNSKLKVEMLFDGFKKNYVRSLTSSLLVSIFLFLWFLLLIVPGIIKCLSYSMTYFILRDRPEISALDAINESRRLMHGKKKNLFYLGLSFIGWYLIPILFFLVTVVTFIAGFATGEIMDYQSFAMVSIGFLSFLLGNISILLISIYVSPYLFTSMAVFYDEFVKPKDSEMYTEEVEEGLAINEEETRSDL